MSDQIQQQQDQVLYQQPYYQQQTYPQAASTDSILGIDLKESQFWKGALVGAAVTLLVTNESVQKGVMKTFSKIGAVAQSGMEEMKEKFEDAKAEAIAESKTKE